MRMRCPKCHKDVETQPRLIEGKTTVVCPRCGHWDFDRSPKNLMVRWAVQICKTCMNYQPVQDMWHAPNKRMCIHDSELSEQDRISILVGECRLFKPITLEALQGEEDSRA